MSNFSSALYIWNKNNGVKYIEDAIEDTKDKEYNINVYWDSVRKYSILRNAKEKLKMDISFIYEEYDELDTTDIHLKEKEEKMIQFNAMSSREVLAKINNKVEDFKNSWNDSFSDNYSFKVGDDIDEHIDEYKNHKNTYGYPFQSGYLTTIYRGMRDKKFIIRSSKSGGGKSRSSMADASNIGCDKLYDWDKHEWIYVGKKEPVLYISVELTKEEINDCILAHITGIQEDRIVEWDDITEEEERVIEEGKQILKDSLVYGEYMPDFTIDSIKDTIEKYILNYDIRYCFFDYINDSPSLYSYYIEKTGVKLQTHQILFMFSESLKRLCNRYGIYLGSSTQLSSNWKDEKDANALKGSKAIIEKADGGVIGLPATSQDIKKLKPILDNGFFKVPNYSYYIFKNRGGRWKEVIVWTSLDMGTMREEDCFVTDYDYNLIQDIETTKLEFEMPSVNPTKFKKEDTMTNEETKEYINKLNETRI